MRVQNYYEQICNILGNEYIIDPNQNFDGRKTKIYVKHICGNQYTTSIESILLNSKCKKCSIINAANKRRKTTEQFKKEVFELVGDEYTVVDEYNGANNKISFIHNICNKSFNMRPSQFLNGTSIGKKTKGYRCPYCEVSLKRNRAINRRKTTEQFKKEVFELVGDEYTVVGEYNGAREKIKMLHSTCKNIIDTTPNKFLSQKRRCKYCNGKSNAEHIIMTILTNNKISFEKEYKFSNLKDILPLRYDFYIKINDSKILLEFHGGQHYYNVDYFGGEAAFEKRQAHDQQKIKYANDNNIPLYILNNLNTLEEDLQKIIDHYKSDKLTGNPLEL